MTLRRHDLLSVSSAAWEEVREAFPALAQQPLVGDWAAQGWPVIVRRWMGDEARSSVPAALPLPPAHGKLRLAFSFASADGLQAFPPISLRVAAVSAPPRWNATIAHLLDLSAELEVKAHVFGSLLWQHISALPYVTDTSDLDLRWQIPDAAVAASLIEQLAKLDKQNVVRVDGELELPDGAGVNWREMRQLQEGKVERVLAKTLDGVELRTKGTLFSAGFEAGLKPCLVAP